jgi:Raf kinase inhibitor-like YbhB/YbcL family protein
LVTACLPAPVLQGAEITTPGATKAVVEPSIGEQDGDLPTSAPESQDLRSTPVVEPTSGELEVEGTRQPFTLESTAFGQGDPIPLRHSCDGEGMSPELSWVSPPEGTGSFALVMDDPDAPGGTWVHWVLFNIPADLNGLPEAVPPSAELADGSRQGTNSGRALGYAGPCPPGGTHRYFFKLFALDQTLELPAGATADDLVVAAEGHILDQAELMGTYTRD